MQGNNLISWVSTLCQAQGCYEDDCFRLLQFQKGVDAASLKTLGCQGWMSCIFWKPNSSFEPMGH